MVADIAFLFTGELQQQPLVTAVTVVVAVAEVSATLVAVAAAARL